MSPSLMEKITSDRLKVDYDTYTMSVSELCSRFGERIDVAPEFQRKFVWDSERQSKLIESIILGIPMPEIFMAYSSERSGIWEVVDGVQRVTSVVGFVDPENRYIIESVKPNLTVRLQALEQLSYLNGLSFSELDDETQNFLKDRTVKIVVLNDKSDNAVRYQLFERLNTGGIKLTEQEIRNAVYLGPFRELLDELSAHPHFDVLYRSKSKPDSEREEFVLKGFAYFDWMPYFKHDVSNFLTQYMEEATESCANDRNLLSNMKSLFVNTIEKLAYVFPDGIVRTRKTVTPANLFEAVFVGGAIAYYNNIPVVNGGEYVTMDEELKKFTTGATNSSVMLNARVARAFYLLTGVEYDGNELKRPEFVRFPTRDQDDN